MKTNTLSYITIIAFALGAIFLSSCEQVDLDASIKPTDAKTKSVSDNEINYKVSLKSARYLIQSTEGISEIKSVEPMVYQGDTLMYIFNFKEGWQVVSGDKRTEPILASDEKGSLSTDRLDNPGVATWLNDMADQISLIKQENPEIEDKETIKLWMLIDKATHLTEENLQRYREKHQAIYSTDKGQLKSTQYPVPVGYRWVKRFVGVSSTPWKTSYQKGPLLQTKWGQGNPWDTNVPKFLKTSNNGKTGWDNCATGCVAVAISQVLYNLHYKIGKPNGLYHSISCTGWVHNSKNYSINFSRGDYNPSSNRWDYMKKSWFSGGNASYVGDLMADVGNRVKMKYGEQSGASTEKEAIPTFKSYGISCSKSDYNYSTVYDNLKRNLPVIVSAYATKKSKGSWFWKKTYYKNGHAWVIDGYRQKKKTFTYSYVWELVVDDSMDRFDPYDPYAPPYLYDPYERYPHEIPPPNVFPGMLEKDTSSSTSTYLLMNWGWNGSHDSGEYSTSSAAKWNGSGYDFQYKKRIFYNFN